ncbi:MAG TPA: GNAT family protein [Symbiobacteriaceae bacterium]|jgi:RimJ/RimL family protein N-acetyltransferase
MATPGLHNDVQIRSFQPADLPAVLTGAAEMGWGLLTPAERRLTSPDEVARRTGELIGQALRQPGALVLVAEAGGVVVAFEFLVIRQADISGLTEALKLGGWVAPAYRRRGLNQRMHQAGEDCCRELGVQRMVAVVATQNAASLGATAKSGFVTEKVVRAKWLTQDLPPVTPK